MAAAGQPSPPPRDTLPPSHAPARGTPAAAAGAHACAVSHPRPTIETAAAQARVPSRGAGSGALRAVPRERGGRFKLAAGKMAE